MLVFTALDEAKLNVQTVKECISEMAARGCMHALIVYLDSITPIVKKLVAHAEQRIELFQQHELGYNVTKHELVPAHRRATGSERAALHKHMPYLAQMSATDPVARFLGFQSGDVVHIARRDGTVAYRVVT